MEFLLKRFGFIPKNQQFNLFHCPFHQGNNLKITHINNYNQLHCWSCCQNFDIISIYQKLTNSLNFRLTINKLTELFNSNEYQNFKPLIIINRKQNRDYIKKNEPIFEEESNSRKEHFKNYSSTFNLVTKFYHQKLLRIIDDNQNKFINYLFIRRKLNLTTIKEFKLGLSSDNNRIINFQLRERFLNQPFFYNKLIQTNLLIQKTNKKQQKYFCDTFFNSIIIPIEFGFNQTFFFYENNFDNKLKPKYKTTKKFTQLPTFLIPFRFFENLFFIKEKGVVIIHEGFFDVITCYQNGIKNVVGLIVIQQKMTSFFIYQLKKYQLQVIILLDNDETGIKRSKTLKKEFDFYQINSNIKRFPSCFFQYKDPDELINNEGIEVYKKIIAN